MNKKKKRKKSFTYNRKKDPYLFVETVQNYIRSIGVLESFKEYYAEFSPTTSRVPERIDFVQETIYMDLQKKLLELYEISK